MRDNVKKCTVGVVLLLLLPQTSASAANSSYLECLSCLDVKEVAAGIYKVLHMHFFLHTERLGYVCLRNSDILLSVHYLDYR